MPACTTALVTSSLVRTTASSTTSAYPHPWRVSRTKARAVATDRPTGSKVAAARAVITELLVRVSTPGSAMIAACPSRCPVPVLAPHRPRRADGAVGQPDARLLTFAVRADAGRCCFRLPGVGTLCEAAELLWPGSAMVKHWAGFRRQPGQYGQPLREGHGGVWRGGACHNTRAKGGRSRNNGTTEVDSAALNRLLAALVSMRDGNFRERLTVSGDGVMAEIAAVFNEVADRNLHLTGELARVRRMVGREGKLTERLETGACEGSWAAAIDASNALVDDLARPVSEVGRVLSAVAEGDLEQRMELRSHAPDGRTGTAAARRIPEGRPYRQQPGRPAVGVHRRGDAGGAGGRYRGQARRPGTGARYVRFVERSHGFGQHDGVPADRSGT